jgi:iron complex transport system ATP-binding protein
MLSVRDLRCGYGGRVVLDRVSLDLGAGEVLAILGPNGIGKTTLFKALLHLHPALSGSIKVDGEEIGDMSSRRRARILAYVPQAHAPPFPFAAIDVVTMGRTARLGTFSSPSAGDIGIAEGALDALGIAALRDRIYTELSGGERQLVLIARALAQQPRILVLDEPTSNLDFGNQVRVLSQVRRLAAQGLGVIMTTHFPDHVYLCSSSVALLGRDGIIHAGPVDEVMTEKRLEAAYAVPVRLATLSLGEGQAYRTCVPLMPRA